MKIILAPDSYKGSLTAFEVCKAMERGIRSIIPNAEIISVPMADGGEGTVKSLVDATGGRTVIKNVTGPLGEKVEASFGILGDGKTAVIEMAQASGLPLVPPEKRDPRITTTYGTGELILAAVAEGCNKLIIGIGGSATNDGGAGMAQALGFRLLDQNGEQLLPGGAALKKLDRIETCGKAHYLEGIEVIVACDVNNPLTGLNGASVIYGPQKGANLEMVKELDQALEHFADVIYRDLKIAIRDLPGTGAAGGLGAGLLAFLNAEIKSGINIVMEVVDFATKIKNADYILTGEGATDFQSKFGKVPCGIAEAARKWGKPVICISGTLGKGYEEIYDLGITAFFSIVNKPMALEESMARGAELLEQVTGNIFRLLITK